MGKPTGFLEYERKDAAQIPPAERICNFQEFKKPLTLEEQSAFRAPGVWNAAFPSARRAR